MKQNFALNMFPALTGLSISFARPLDKKWLHLFKFSLLYFDLWVKLLKFVETLFLCLFKDMFNMPHIFSLPNSLTHPIFLRPCWMAGLMSPVVIYQPLILLFDCIHPYFSSCHNSTCLISF